jgi:hypothetical protein|tara:strand:- start:3205 stop:3591 length:387 start_codon:yes stop_codon:yes gene_type:complete
MPSEEEVRKSNAFNRNNGRNKQELARKLLKVPDNVTGKIPADEEDWNSNVLFEVKSGKQIDPIATRFYNAESQSQEFVDSLGKKKPFSMVAMPTGTGDGIFMCRLSSLEKVVEALQENWKKYEEQENE